MPLIPSILGVGLDEPTRRDATDFDAIAVQTPGEAIQQLNLHRFDVVIGGPSLADAEMAALAQGLDQLFPSQCWAIVACDLDLDRQRACRAMGCVGLFGDLFTCLHFACSQGLDPPVTDRRRMEPDAAAPTE